MRCCRKGFQETVEKNEIGLPVVEQLPKKGEINKYVIEKWGLVSANDAGELDV